jgi:glucokinase
VRAIGVDVGGTTLTVAGLSGAHDLVGAAEQPSAGLTYETLLDSVAAEVKRLRPASGSPPRLGVAIAGWLTADRERVEQAANLGWEGRSLRADLAGRTGLETTVHNDGNAAAWGEFLLAGRPQPGAFVMMTLGTDVGGGVVVNGRLVTGAFGVAGELGHLQVAAEGPRCVCGSQGCLAVYSSGRAMVSRYAEGRPGVTGADLSAAIRQGEPVAVAVLSVAARAIALASAQVSRVVDHQWLVLGGGASGIDYPLVEAVENALADTAAVGPTRPLPQVFLARAGNHSGVLGAADLADRRDD